MCEEMGSDMMAFADLILFLSDSGKAFIGPERVIYRTSGRL